MRSFAVATCVLFSSMDVYAENWPQWRGPSLNGISGESNLPVKWTTTENIAWKLPIPAWSGSTPIVWGDRIFLNVAENGSLFLWAVDRTKGEADLEASPQRWRSPGAQTEHVDAVAGDRRHQRVGDDRHGHFEGVRLCGEGAVDSRHPEGIRAVRSPVGLRIVADALWRLAVRAGAARDENRRPVVRLAHQQNERPHDLAAGAAHERAAWNRPIRTRRRRSSGTATISSSSLRAAMP